MKYIVLILLILSFCIPIFSQENFNDSVSYVADELFYDVVLKKAKLYGNVNIIFQNFTLKSDTVALNLPKSILTSKGNALVKSQSDNFIGSDLWFDTENEYGLFKSGSGKLDLGYFYGTEIRKTGEKEYDVDNGFFTTCDDPDEHYDFYSTKMRIYKNDKIVMKPVVFFVNHMPIFIMPTGSFSVRKGKKAGMLTPRPGYNSIDGKFIENIAYFAFYKDYIDALLVFNIRERTGMDGNFLLNYVKRYKYTGSVDIRQKRTTSEAGRRTDIQGEYHYKHNQKFEDGSSFAVGINYVTQSQLLKDKQDVDQRLAQTVNSSVNYSKPFLSSVLNISNSYSENILTRTKTVSLPAASFSLPTRPVYEIFLTEKPAENQNFWWKDFSYSISFAGSHSGTINENNSELDDILYKSQKAEDGSFKNTHNAGVSQKVSLTHGKKLFNWLNFSQSVPFNSAYSSKEMNYEPFNLGYDYRYNSSIGFNIYGFKNIPAPFFKGIRHTIAISSNYAYKPDFRKINKDYEGIYGIDKSNYSKSMNASISNTWDFKVDPFGKTDEKRLNGVVTANTSYLVFDNERKDVWSDIEYNGNLSGTDLLTVAFGIGPLSYSLSNPNSAYATQDPYNFEIKRWGYDSRLNNGVVMTLKSSKKYFNYFPSENNKFETNRFFNPSGAKKTENFITKNNSITSSYSYNYFYKYDYTKESGGSKYDDYSNNLNNKATYYLSPTWQISYSNTYNIKESDLVSQNLSVQKDLHCWAMNFTFTKSGIFWSYSLNFFNIALPNDLKYDRQGNSND